MQQLIAYPVDAGESTVIVEMDSEATGLGRVGRAGDLAATASRTFEEALDSVRPAAEALVEKLRDIARGPDTIAVEFGVKLTLQTGAIIASSTGEGHFTVRLEWTRGAQ